MFLSPLFSCTFFRSVSIIKPSRPLQQPSIDKKTPLRPPPPKKPDSLVQKVDAELRSNHTLPGKPPPPKKPPVPAIPKAPENKPSRPPVPKMAKPRPSPRSTPTKPGRPVPAPRKPVSNPDQPIEVVSDNNKDSDSKANSEDQQLMLNGCNGVEEHDNDVNNLENEIHNRTVDKSENVTQISDEQPNTAVSEDIYDVPPKPSNTVSSPDDIYDIPPCTSPQNSVQNGLLKKSEILVAESDYAVPPTHTELSKNVQSSSSTDDLYDVPPTLNFVSDNKQQNSIDAFRRGKIERSFSQDDLVPATANEVKLKRAKSFDASLDKEDNDEHLAKKKNHRYENIDINSLIEGRCQKKETRLKIKQRTSSKDGQSYENVELKNESSGDGIYSILPARRRPSAPEFIESLENCIITTPNQDILDMSGNSTELAKFISGDSPESTVEESLSQKPPKPVPVVPFLGLRGKLTTFHHKSQSESEPDGANFKQNSVDEIYSSPKEPLSATTSVFGDNPELPSRWSSSSSNSANSRNSEGAYYNVTLPSDEGTYSVPKTEIGHSIKSSPVKQKKTSEAENLYMVPPTSSTVPIEDGSKNKKSGYEDVKLPTTAKDETGEFKENKGLLSCLDYYFFYLYYAIYFNLCH